MAGPIIHSTIPTAPADERRRRGPGLVLDGADPPTLAPYDDGLEDEFGQELRQRFTTSFRTADASPRLYMETGIYAIEGESDGYPVWSRNVNEFQVECAHVPARRIPTVLTTTMDYDPWYSDRTEGIDWQELGLRPTTHTVQVQRVLNRWTLHNIDLPAQCRGRGQGGIYLAEFRSDEVRDGLGDRGRSYIRYPYRILGNVTNLGVLLKAGPSSGLVWVAKLSDGTPVAGAAVTVYSPRGRRVFQGRTDANGILRMPGSSELLRQRGTGDQHSRDQP